MNLMETVKRGGDAVIQTPRFEGLNKAVKMAGELFDRVRVIYYHGRLSRFYEKRFMRRPESEGWEKGLDLNKTFSGINRLTPLCTLLFEVLFNGKAGKCRGVLLICEGEKDGGGVNFPYEVLNKVEDRVYAVGGTPLVEKLEVENGEDETAILRESLHRNNRERMRLQRYTYFRAPHGNA